MIEVQPPDLLGGSWGLSSLLSINCVVHQPDGPSAFLSAGTWGLFCLLDPTWMDQLHWFVKIPVVTFLGFLMLVFLVRLCSLEPALVLVIFENAALV